MITRQTLYTLGGSPIYLDAGYHSAPRDRPLHLVGCGKYFATPAEAQAYIDVEWFRPHVADNTYAMAESRFGEVDD